MATRGVLTPAAFIPRPNDLLRSLRRSALPVDTTALARFLVGLSDNSKGHLRQLFVDQVCQATGGPCIYIGRDMKTSHKGMRITEEDWAALMLHLNATLDHFQVPAAEKDAVVGFVQSTKGDVVEA